MTTHAYRGFPFIISIFVFHLNLFFNSEIEKLVEELHTCNVTMDLWDYEGIHYFDNGPLTVQYLLVLDALNFCFWPGNVSWRFLVYLTF